MPSVTGWHFVVVIAMIFATVASIVHLAFSMGAAILTREGPTLTSAEQDRKRASPATASSPQLVNTVIRET